MPPPAPTATLTPPPTLTPRPTGAVDLSIQPAQFTFDSVNSSNNFTLRLTASNLTPVGFQLKLTYDATLLEVVDADPNRAGVQVTPVTTVFDSQVRNRVTVEGGVGTILYSYYTSTPDSVPLAQPLDVATLQFRLISPIPAGQSTSVSFLMGGSANTVITDEQGFNILGNAAGVTVALQ